MAALTATVNPDGGEDYLSLNAMDAGEGQDLTDGGGDTHTTTCTSGGTADTTVWDVDGWTTGATNYIKATSGAGHRASTAWDASKYRYSMDDANAFQVREDYIWFDGLQIEITGQTGAMYFFWNITRASGWIKLSNCVLRGDGGAQRLGFYVLSTGAFTDLIMWNCLCYNWGSNSLSYFNLTNAATTWNVYNSTFIWPATTIAGIRRENGTLTCKNVYSGGNTAGRDFFGTVGTTTCVSSDNTGDITGIAVSTDNFVDVTIDGGEDWALPVGSGLIGVGTDDVLADAGTDINGDSRTSTWDVGADEFVAAGGGEVFIENLTDLISKGMKPQTAAGLGGVLVE